jgi:hypothetical protein
LLDRPAHHHNDLGVGQAGEDQASCEDPPDIVKILLAPLAGIGINIDDIGCIPDPVERKRCFQPM